MTTLNTVQIEDNYPIHKLVPLSLQHLLGMFGSSILVPLIYHIDPAIVLLCNGIGTLIYLLVTKFKVPAVMGASFSFIAPTLAVIPMYGYNAACGSYIICGASMMILGFIIKKTGVNWIEALLPPSAVGIIMIVIGLQLNPIIIERLGLNSSFYSIDPKIAIVFFSTLIICVLGLLTFRGFFLIIVMLIAMLSGYIIAVFLGMIDFTPVLNAPWIALPKFYKPEFNLNSTIIILPAVIVLSAENLGHFLVTGNIISRDLMHEPGLGSSFLGNGLSTFTAGLFGSVPDTTYAENIGIMSVTKIYSKYVFIGVAVLAILLGFIKKIAVFLESVPFAVIGGVSVFLLGVIAIAGIQLLIESKVDYKKSKNLIMSAIVLFCGVSGIQLNFGSVIINGMCLSAIVAIIISLIFIILKKLQLLNEEQS